MAKFGVFLKWLAGLTYVFVWDMLEKGSREQGDLIISKLYYLWQLIAAWPLVKNIITLRFKGALRSPFLYFGAFFVILGFSAFWQEPSSEAPRQSFSEKLFLSAPRSFMSESPKLLLVENSSLQASVPASIITPQALGVLLGTPYHEVARREIVEYVVAKGDTLSDIALAFNISEDTVRWVNDIEGSDLEPGQKLTILPVNGALHLVRPQDTLSEIALWYKADIKDIMVFNEITSESQIFAGDLLIIPDGIKPSSLPSPRSQPAKGTNFAYPVGSPVKITQGLHYYNAIDFGASCGSSVYASESGKVQRVGYDAVGGNYIRILHSGGIVTYYGHLAPVGILVSPGQSVGRGQLIGLVGATGAATGCHVHFEVRGAANPFAR